MSKFFEKLLWPEIAIVIIVLWPLGVIPIITGIIVVNMITVTIIITIAIVVSITAGILVIRIVDGIHDTFVHDVVVVVIVVILNDNRVVGIGTGDYSIATLILNLVVDQSVGVSV